MSAPNLLLGKTKNINFVMNLKLFNCVLSHLSAFLDMWFELADKIDSFILVVI